MELVKRYFFASLLLEKRGYSIDLSEFEHEHPKKGIKTPLTCGELCRRSTHTLQKQFCQSDQIDYCTTWFCLSGDFFYSFGISRSLLMNIVIFS